MFCEFSRSRVEKKEKSEIESKSSSLGDCLRRNLEEVGGRGLRVIGKSSTGSCRIVVNTVDACFFDILNC